MEQDRVAVALEQVADRAEVEADRAEVKAVAASGPGREGTAFVPVAVLRWRIN